MLTLFCQYQSVIFIRLKSRYTICFPFLKGGIPRARPQTETGSPLYRSKGFIDFNLRANAVSFSRENGRASEAAGRHAKRAAVSSSK